MSTVLLSSPAAAQRLSLLESAPCALWRWLQARQRPWDAAAVDIAVDAAVGAILLGGANEVLVPASLACYIEQHRCKSTSSLASPFASWYALQEDRMLVVLAAHHEVEGMLVDYPRYQKWCVPVPGGPLSAQMCFRSPLKQFYDQYVGRVVSVMRTAGSDYSWRAWMCSALTCRYEGLYVAPIRVSELTAQLIAQDGGCEEVVWEEGILGLTPRWLETSVKTSLSCGIPMSALRLSLRGGGVNTERLLSKAVEMGITHLATCSAAGQQLFPQTDPMVAMTDAIELAVGINEQGQALTVADEQKVVDVNEYMKALGISWKLYVGE